MRGPILFLSLLTVALFFFNASCITLEVPVTETYYETGSRIDYKTETHTELEEVVIRTVDGEQQIFSAGGWFSSVLHISGGEDDKTYYYPYVTDTSEHTRSKITINVSRGTRGYIGVYNATGIGQIGAPPTPAYGLMWQSAIALRDAWVDNINSTLMNSSRLLGSYQKSSVGGVDDTTSNQIIFNVDGINEFAIITNTHPDQPILNVKLSWSDDITQKKEVTKEVQVPYEINVQVQKQRTVMHTQKVPFWEAIFH